MKPVQMHHQCLFLGLAFGACLAVKAVDAIVHCMQVYVVGGLQTNMTTYAPFIETYDSLLDQWEVPALPADIEPRAFAAVCSL